MRIQFTEEGRMQVRGNFVDSMGPEIYYKITEMLNNKLAANK